MQESGFWQETAFSLGHSNKTSVRGQLTNCGGRSKGHTRETEALQDKQQWEVVTILRHERKELVFPGLERFGLMEAGLSGGCGGVIGVVEEYVRNVDAKGTTALPLSSLPPGLSP